jgi:hypothetical protein
MFSVCICSSVKTTQGEYGFVQINHPSQWSQLSIIYYLLLNRKQHVSCAGLNDVDDCRW